MDHVYVRADTSIGLFNVKLQQSDLDCLLAGYEFEMGVRSPFTHRRGSKPDSRRKPDANFIKAICDTLVKIASDKWNTRAWVLQEAFASSSNMVCLFPRDNVIDIRGWLLLCHELSRSDMAIRLNTIQHCFDIWRPYIQHFLSKDPKNRQMPEKSADKKAQLGSNASQSNTMEESLNKVDFFHPPQRARPMFCYVVDRKPRLSCNAAVALTYLRGRDLFRVADKLAIVANMCDYHLRLDTVQLEKTQKRLSACVLALSLANNDFSLLVPQMYRSPNTSKP